MLRIEYSSKFKRDYKRLVRKHAKIELLDDVIRLIARDDEESRERLMSRHNMHRLRGRWAGVHE